MFIRSAEFYDAIYRSKDYDEEAGKIHDLIQSYNPNARNVLDIACGTGKHAEHLTRYYMVDGIDLNEQFLQIARSRNPQSTFWRADMTSFQLNRQYDAILCLFSAIGCVKTLEKLKQTVEQFKHHLADGGVIIIEPWFEPEDWKPGFVSVLTAETGRHKIVRMTHAERDGNLSIMNFEYLVGSEQGIERCDERHELGLFAQKDLLDIFSAAGLEVKIDPEGLTGRGLYVLWNGNKN